VASLALQPLNEPSSQKVFVLIHFSGGFSAEWEPALTPAVTKEQKKDTEE